jgi:hypothetical protein
MTHVVPPQWLGSLPRSDKSPPLRLMPVSSRRSTRSIRRISISRSHNLSINRSLLSILCPLIGVAALLRGSRHLVLGSRRVGWVGYLCLNNDVGRIAKTEGKVYGWQPSMVLAITRVHACNDSILLHIATLYSAVP